MKIHKHETKFSTVFVSLAVAVVSFALTFCLLYFVLGATSSVNQSGLWIGLYAILGAFYIQWSPKSDSRFALDYTPPGDITIILCTVGASTVFYALRLIETESVETIWIDPVSGVIANSLTVALVSGWVAITYLNQKEENVRQND